MAINPMAVANREEPVILYVPKILDHEECILILLIRLVRYVASSCRVSIFTDNVRDSYFNDILWVLFTLFLVIVKFFCFISSGDINLRFSFCTWW